MKISSNLKENLKEVGQGLIEDVVSNQDPIKEMLDEVANRYTESPATTNAGRFLRFISRFIKPSTIIQLFAHKLTNK